jgi:hypothetical protein
MELELVGETWRTPSPHCHSTLSTTNPTCHDLGTNPGCHDRKLVTKCLSYGTAIMNLIRNIVIRDHPDTLFHYITTHQALKIVF